MVFSPYFIYFINIVRSINFVDYILNFQRIFLSYIFVGGLYTKEKR